MSLQEFPNKRVAKCIRAGIYYCYCEEFSQLLQQIPALFIPFTFSSGNSCIAKLQSFSPCKYRYLTQQCMIRSESDQMNSQQSINLSKNQGMQFNLKAYQKCLYCIQENMEYVLNTKICIAFKQGTCSFYQETAFQINMTIADFTPQSFFFYKENYQNKIFSKTPHIFRKQALQNRKAWVVVDLTYPKTMIRIWRGQFSPALKTKESQISSYL